MPLFKYCDEKGILILENLTLKVTPPDQFPDKNELRPIVCTADPAVRAAQAFDRILNDRSVIEKNLGYKLSDEQFRKYQSKVAPQRAHLTSVLTKEVPRSDKRMQDKLVKVTSTKWGVVSFSADVLNETMWELYGSKYSGMAVEFDAEAQLFSGKSLVKCYYSDDPPVYETRDARDRDMVEKIVSRKRLSYAYEKESRLLVELVLCNKIENLQRECLYTMPINPRIIKSVTLGNSATESFLRKIKAALTQSNLSHVALMQLKLNEQGGYHRAEIAKS